MYETRTLPSTTSTRTSKTSPTLSSYSLQTLAGIVKSKELAPYFLRAFTVEVMTLLKPAGSLTLSVHNVHNTQERRSTADEFLMCDLVDP